MIIIAFWQWKCGASSKFMSSSLPSWQILTAHAQPFRRARDLAFVQKVPLDSLLVWASSGGSGETARMCRLVWTFAARIGDKYQIRLTRSKLKFYILFTKAWNCAIVCFIYHIYFTLSSMYITFKSLLCKKERSRYKYYVPQGILKLQFIQ